MQAFAEAKLVRSTTIQDAQEKLCGAASRGTLSGTFLAMQPAFSGDSLSLND